MATTSTEKNTPPKEYTKEEIEAFTDAQLEEFASHLEWRGASSSYGYASRRNLKQYKTRGHPNSYRDKRIHNRREFLIERLKTSKQVKWNPGIKELEEARKREEEAREAAKPKVITTAEVIRVIRLKDHRPKGHTFKIRVNGKNVTIKQEQNTHASVGRSVCTQAADFKIQDFESVMATLASLKHINLPSNSEAKISIELRGSNNVQFRLRPNNIVGVVENSGYRGYDDNDHWRFNLSDLLLVSKELTKEYEYKLVEKTEKGTFDKAAKAAIASAKKESKDAAAS